MGKGILMLCCVLLLGCASTPEQIATDSQDIRTLAESSRSRFVGHDDPEGVAEQTAIIEKAGAISVAAAAVDPTQPAWQGTLELGLWTALLLTLAVVVWQTGLGTLLRRLFNLIPERKRSAAKLLREAVEHPENIREAAAAIRTADPMINAAWKG